MAKKRERGSYSSEIKDSICCVEPPTPTQNPSKLPPSFLHKTGSFALNEEKGPMQLLLPWKQDCQPSCTTLNMEDLEIKPWDNFTLRSNKEKDTVISSLYIALINFEFDKGCWRSSIFFYVQHYKETQCRQNYGFSWQTRTGTWPQWFTSWKQVYKNA